jgi:hypothetical protein
MTKQQSDYLLHLFNYYFGRARWQTTEGGTDFDYLREGETLYLYFQWTE